MRRARQGPARELTSISAGGAAAPGRGASAGGAAGRAGASRPARPSPRAGGRTRGSPCAPAGPPWRRRRRARGRRGRARAPARRAASAAARRKARQDPRRDVRRRREGELVAEPDEGALELGHPPPLQLLAQPLERPRRPRLDGAAPPAERRGRLLLGEPEEVAAGDRQPVVLAQFVRPPPAAPPGCSASRMAASGDGTAPPESGSSAARSASRSRRPADLRRFRASLATIASSHGRKGAPCRNRPSAL